MVDIPPDTNIGSGHLSRCLSGSGQTIPLAAHYVSRNLHYITLINSGIKDIFV